MKMKSLLIVLALLAVLACASYAQTAEAPKAGDDGLQDVTFKDVDAKDAIKMLARSLKVNVVFDESVRIPGKLNLELEHVTQEAVLKILLIQHKLRASWIEERTIMVYADNPQLRERFLEFKLWEPTKKPGK